MNKYAFEFKKVKKNVKRLSFNEDIADYYNRKAIEDDNYSLKEHSKNLKLCLKFWDVDCFQQQKIKDVKRVNCCKDLFCKNCQHNLSLKRFAKYKNILDDLSKSYDLYHIVFTVPNCESDMLKVTLKKMYAKFRYITEYFKGTSKSAFFNFNQFGYAGCVRSLEITFHNEGSVTMFHPHFHCIFLLKKDLELKKLHYNKFSFSNRTEKVKSYSRFEIFLQKFWYLIYNDMSFTENNFNNLKLGYSVSADKCKPGKYHEVFKYAVGGLFKKGFDLTYDIFSSLLDNLHRRKMIQGYGLLNRFKFEEANDELIDGYNAYRSELEQVEQPKFIAEKLLNVLNEIESGTYTYISKFQKNYEDT